MKRTKRNKSLSILLTIVILVGIFVAGCGGQNSNDNSQPTDKQTADQKTGDNNSGDVESEDKVPVTLTYFWDMDPKATMSMKSYEEIACFKEAEKKTGVNIEWKHPPAGQGTEQFNLMLASQDLPDLIYWSWRSISGGPAKAIEDGSIIKLNDLIDQYAPNFKAVLQENPEWKKQAILDDGTLYMFPFIRGHKDLRLPDGFQMRKDWLDKLGLEVPKTIDDWYTVLTAFKENDVNGNGDPDDEVPFVSKGLGSVLNFSWAWGIRKSFYMDGDKVKFGAIQP